MTDDFIDTLRRQESEVVTSVMAFMSYNPSIGRVLEGGGVGKFQRLAAKLVDELPRAVGRESFDQLHNRYMRCLITNVRTARGRRLSYGQAQKPVNVFLKVYVDWAGRPTTAVRRRLIRHLHVPLDSVLMKTVKTHYPEWYDSIIRPYLKKRGQAISLAKMDKRLYLRWQEFFRREAPQNPLFFDLAWAVNR